VKKAEMREVGVMMWCFAIAIVGELHTWDEKVTSVLLASLELSSQHDAPP
jgi:hypothetical protein